MVNVHEDDGDAVLAQSSDSPINRVSRIPAARLISDGNHSEHVKSKSDTLRSYSVPSDFETVQCRTAAHVKQVPRDDDIVFVEDVDICLAIPPKLRQLDYPRVEDGHDEDVAKVIRKKFAKLGLDEGTPDVLAILSSDKLKSGYISWQAQIEEAAEEEADDTFWENVCLTVAIT